MTDFEWTKFVFDHATGSYKGDSQQYGRNISTFWICDLRIYCDLLHAKLYRYRDRRGREADADMEFNDGAWALIKVKLGDQNDIDLAANNLRRLSEDITNHNAKPAFLMVVTKDHAAY